MKITIQTLLATVLLVATLPIAKSDELVISADHLSSFSLPKSRVAAPGYLNNDSIKVPGFTFVEGPAQTFTSMISEDLGDWTGLTAVVLRLYSPAASGARVAVLFRSAEDLSPPKAFPTNYWWTTIKADWVGWKDITIRTNTLFARKVTGDPQKVSQIIFRSTMGPDEDTNTAGIRQSMPHTWGFERITILK